jgi:hypothetical protein
MNRLIIQTLVSVKCADSHSTGGRVADGENVKKGVSIFVMTVWEKNKMQKQTIAIDFDGVIHAYSQGWHDGDIYDDPVPGTKEAIKKLMNKGYKVVVFTARTDLEEIGVWLKYHDIVVDKITNTKPRAIAYIDDRGIRFTNWKDILNYF